MARHVLAQSDEIGEVHFFEDIGIISFRLKNQTVSVELDMFKQTGESVTLDDPLFELFGKQGVNIQELFEDHEERLLELLQMIGNARKALGSGLGKSDNDRGMSQKSPDV